MVNNLYFPLSLLRISRQLIMVLRIRMDIILCLEIQYHREMLSVISPLILLPQMDKKVLPLPKRASPQEMDPWGLK
jgi:hypothetical protein